MDLRSLPRIVLGIVFIVASVDKIIDPAAFAVIIKNYQILPEMLIGPVAIYLPWFEFVCGAMLLCNVLTGVTAGLVIVMLLAFTTALGANFYRGIDVACGCFSTDVTQSSNMLYSMIRDGILLFMAFLSFRFKALK